MDRQTKLLAQEEERQRIEEQQQRDRPKPPLTQSPDIAGAWYCEFPVMFGGVRQATYWDRFTFVRSGNGYAVSVRDISAKDGRDLNNNLKEGRSTATIAGNKVRVVRTWPPETGSEITELEFRNGTLVGTFTQVGRDGDADTYPAKCTRSLPK
jgi:hypothetical protein